eukprot:TRINITY_DN35663_c0_g1_i1.p1 TRINITY_DN35663_c0_g1~~TRINITY_DN35663_c0_g1_i1.p1  ORF type:complete len:178 (-),score=5.09 TRINITY_DN35663_c0_g1_i1:3-536(-)
MRFLLFGALLFQLFHLFFAFDRSFPLGGGICDKEESPNDCFGKCLNSTCICDAWSVCPNCNIPISLAETYKRAGHYICSDDFKFGGGACSTDSDCGGSKRGRCINDVELGGSCKCNIGFGCANCFTSIADYLSGSKCSDFDYKFGGRECERRSECGYPEQGTCARSIFENDGIAKCR